MKGLFIPGITTEMFKNCCFKSIEILRTEGEIYDVDIPVVEHKKTFLKNDGWVELSSLPNGTTIKFGGIQWKILDNHFPAADGREGVLCLATDILFKKAFDRKNRNNWKESTLRDCLNGDFKNILAAKIFDNTLLPFKRNLLSDDGMKDYGKCIDYISIISCDEYRKYRDYINDKPDWWWTLTPWNIPRSGTSCSALAVTANGAFNICATFDGNNGVVPVLCVSPSLKVQVVPQDNYKL